MSFPFRTDATSFRFLDCDYKESTAVLRYGIDESVVFEERIHFHNAPQITEEKKEAVQACLRLLHLAAGVSYYKAYIPSRIFVEKGSLTQEEADFFNLFYRSGLGEFSYRNKVHPEINFPYSENTFSRKARFYLPEKTVVPVGGGKDSIVTVETLKKTGREPVLFSVGLPRAIKETIEYSELSSILVTRTISPHLIELNRNAETYGTLNGHVPVTGIIAFILALSAVLYDFSDVVMSNERSANIGNTAHDGIIVNHQWSKSIEFEKAFTGLIKNVLPNFRYFSLLRPLSELSIARLFSKTGKYDDVFTSCNRAFRLDETKRLDRWCGECDKCRFVFLMLAPFMPKEKLIHLFGQNPLNDPQQIDGFKELMGLSAFKPFECVGEIEESAVAFMMIANRPEWQEAFVVKALKQNVFLRYGTQLSSLTEKFFAVSENHFIPEEYQDVLEFFKR